MAKVSTFGITVFRDQLCWLHELCARDYLLDKEPFSPHEEMVPVFNRKEKNQFKPYNLFSPTLSSFPAAE
jgi:hypothetical protein